MELVVIDYGAGNVINVMNAFKKLGVRCSTSRSERAWKEADALVLPGVGAFGAAIRNLGDKSNALKVVIRESGVPFFGICLGMQILLDESEESPKVEGLGLISGKVRRFRTALPVPHMGWNEVQTKPSPLFEGMERFYAYFVHSYYCEPKERSCISATTKYGSTFVSAFLKGNIFATQFHPEKSGEAGLQILNNFIKEVKR